MALHSFFRRRSRVPLSAALLAFSACFPVHALAANVVTTDQVRAEVVVHAPDGIAPGAKAWLGLVIDHQPHWHTYWRNAGDSGLPTTVTWQLPGGATAGDIQWPTPHKLPVGPLVNYGYEGKLLLPVALTIPAGFSAPTFDIKLRADWLVCKEVCIPQGGDFTLSVPAQAASVANRPLFETAFAAEPKPLAGEPIKVRFEGNAIEVKVAGLPADWQGKKIDYFAEDMGVIDHAAPPDQRWEGSTLVTRVPLSAQRSDSPGAMHAVLNVPGNASGVRVALAAAGVWPTPSATSSAESASTEPAAAAPAAAAGSWLAAMGLALVGGLLLNLMPCVFPILSLKVIGFTKHSHQRRVLVAGGLAYTAGVVLSFVALAAAVLLLRAGGEQLGWGFQLQSPPVVAGLVLLFTLIGLNLAGVFDWRGIVPGNLAGTRLEHPVADQALTGVLAVAVASPCTAPFMGAALGTAFTQPAPFALAIFAALGLGMALPYLAACLWPGLANLLPRPGAWMERFKVAMAFPMFATVIWLIWVVGQQVGLDGAVALLGVALALAFVCWALGAPGFGRAARTGFGAVALVVLAMSVVWAWPSLRAEATPVAAVESKSGAWRAWSPEAVSQARAAGKPVFVDFTAAWCVTCQYNKRTTLAHPDVRREFDTRQVVLLRADWTRRDAAITQELARMGRNGVPVYALYAPGGTQPQLLSELLSVAEVRSAMARW